MLSWGEIGPYLVAAVLICISPGPAFALILRTSAVSGWRAAMPVLAGAEIGVVLWAFLAALGVAALIIEAHGGSMKPAQVEAKLKQSSDDLGKRGKDEFYGQGYVNALNAIQ